MPSRPSAGRTEYLQRNQFLFREMEMYPYVPLASNKETIARCPLPFLCPCTLSNHCLTIVRTLITKDKLFSTILRHPQTVFLSPYGTSFLRFFAYLGYIRQDKAKTRQHDTNLLHSIPLLIQSSPDCWHRHPFITVHLQHPLQFIKMYRRILLDQTDEILHVHCQ